MRSKFVIVMLLTCVTASFAQQHYDSRKLSKYLQRLLHEQNAASTRSASVPQQPASVCTLMKMEVNCSVNDVASLYGCQVVDSIGQVYFVRIPVSSLGQMSLDSRVQRIEAHEMPQQLMFEVPQHIKADKAWQGAGLPQAFTGRGVVAGIVDEGFDFTHPMFLDTLGSTRICRFYDMLQIADDASKGLMYDSEQIMELQHSPMAKKEYHGTNVASIMVGSKVAGDKKSYCGIAPESDIVLAEIGNNLLGTLLNYDDGTTADCILGAKRIFDYADNRGEPCVVNYSLGWPMPIDDPCTLENEALQSLVGPGHIIVAGAGNDGFSSGSGWETIYPTMKKQSNEKEVTASFFGVNDEKSSFSYAEAIEFYVRSEHPQEISLFLGPDSIGKSIMVRTDLLDYLSGDTLHLADNLQPFASDTAYVSAFKIVDAPSYVEGNLYMFSISIGNSENKNLSSWLYKHMKSVSTPEYSRIRVGDGLRLTIDGDNPCEAYTSPKYTPFIHAYTPNSDNLSFCINKEHAIAWPASSPHVISVGALASFSSQGPTWTGLIKPETCAPGESIVVAHNLFGPFKFPYEWVSGISGVEGCMDMGNGTSLSSPMVAGAIALWLQAKPDLTPEEIREVLAKTCLHPVDTISYPNNQYGYGEIDVYAGLLHILGISGIEQLSVNQPVGIRAKLNGRQLTVIDEQTGQPYSGQLTIKIYSMDGLQVASVNGNSVNLQAAQPGIYAVQFTANNTKNTGSTLIRL